MTRPASGFVASGELEMRTVCPDSRQQWPPAGNVRHNSMTRDTARTVPRARRAG